MTRLPLGSTALGGAALLSCCLLVAACGGGSAASASAPASEHGLAARAAPGALPSPAAASANRAGQTAALAPASQSIVYTASLTIRTANVADTAKRAIAIATAVGGYVADEHAISGSPGTTGGTVDLTLKIPVPSYQFALGQLSSAALGKQLAMQQQAKDVTQEVADVTSLVASQRDAIGALQGLLKRAASVSGLLQVQRQISSDESSLNSLLAQQRALDRETAYATVSVTLVSQQAPVKPHKPARHGFLPGLASGWKALQHGAVWLATALGAALPFLIVGFVLAGVGYAARRRVLARRGTRPTG